MASLTFFSLHNYLFTYHSLKPKSSSELQNSFEHGQTTRELADSTYPSPSGVLHSPNWVAGSALGACCLAGTAGIALYLPPGTSHTSVWDPCFQEPRTSLSWLTLFWQNESLRPCIWISIISLSLSLSCPSFGKPTHPSGISVTFCKALLDHPVGNIFFPPFFEPLNTLLTSSLGKKNIWERNKLFIVYSLQLSSKKGGSFVCCVGWWVWGGWTGTTRWSLCQISLLEQGKSCRKTRGWGVCLGGWMRGGSAYKEKRQLMAEEELWGWMWRK